MTDKTELQPAMQDQGNSKKKYTRFDISQRIEHILFLLSFTVLGITGLVQRYSGSPISQQIILSLGGIESTRLIHHWAAVVMMIVSIFHILNLLYRIYVLRVPWSMMPVIEDAKHLIHDISYYLGIRKEQAYYGRYNYAEKMEYLAVVWGTIIMGITGFMMWNPILTAQNLPGQIIPAAKAAHSAEAILAVLSVLLWHFYHVHLRHFNKSMFTGKLTHQEMKVEHPAELAQIEAGRNYSPPPSTILRKRKYLFFPFAIVVGILMVFSAYQFITIEDTALAQASVRESAEVFVPVTPTPKPTPTQAPTSPPPEGVSANSWKGTYEAIFRNRCGTCHGITAVGGLSLATYQDTLIGGDNGPAIIPGNPEASILVQVQLEGGHPGQLTPEEITSIIDWIEAGAPEQ
ncbi:MAG: cytochrome b/b6 domain-containing protein [Anaerolineaceae bacterium]|nr:cytochrome b/b6 domain-containing protein [Anaerolineaceae bacterium]